MYRGSGRRRLNPLPMCAAVVGGVLVLGTLIGQGGHAKGDTDEDLSSLSVSMPGMSMPGMSMGSGASGGTDMNSPGMPPVAAVPNEGTGSGAGTVTLRPGTAGTAGGMEVRLVKISRGAATVAMGQDSAVLRQGASKKFPDGMSVRAVKVTKDRATLKVTPSW
ncbi:MAG TPA: hypothetical protein VGJ14_11540 [Sporichthyaceae bacterium]